MGGVADDNGSVQRTRSVALPGWGRGTWTIARFTLHEAVSRRLILAGFLLSIAFLGLFALGFSYLYGNVAQATSARPTANSQQALAGAGAAMTLLGIYAINFLASFLALFLAVGSVSSEIDSGTLHAVMARPLRRGEFIVGRWLAYVGLSAAYVGLMVAALLLISRAISGYQPPDPVRATALITLGTLVLLTLSLFGSTLMPTLANGVVVFSLFGLAWFAGIIEFIGRLISNTAMLNLSTVVSLLVPSDALWRGASYYLQSPLLLVASGSATGIPFFSGAPPTPALVLWSMAYPLVFLGAAVWAFARRDL